MTFSVSLRMLCAFLCMGTYSGTVLSYAQNVRQVVVQNGSISPTEITVPQGTKVTIRVTNRGPQSHNFVIPDFFIFSHNLKSGETVTLSFTPDKTGDFPYYSDKNGVPEPGIKGTLHVK